MVNSINGLKKNLETIFKFIKSKLNKNQIDDFLIQIAIYRDYDCENEILEFSGWEKNPVALIQFLEKVEVFGGDDIPEAVEIGLQYANKLSNTSGLSQVILIGDSPPKEIEAIERDRKNYGGEDFWLRLYGPPTVWREQMQLLKKNKIPIHSIYLDNKGSTSDAKLLEQKFKQISEATQGESIYIDLKKSESETKIENHLSYLLLKSIYGY